MPALSRALGAALADAVEGSGQSAPEARKAASEYARAWSMDTLAERYVDVYTRAVAAHRAVGRGAGAETPVASRVTTPPSPRHPGGGCPDGQSDFLTRAAYNAGCFSSTSQGVKRVPSAVRLNLYDFASSGSCSCSWPRPSF